MGKEHTPERFRVVAPGASESELEAIRIALGTLWPDPHPPMETVIPVWRFSGRWWLDRDSEPLRQTSR
ncbi:MAG TPA: hypothetical protein DF783_07435 [Acidimicrobiaceae bacterium]|nr:hypothetical protein [Acidimicrobiaceae bacterium]HCV36745.1 hypothetical protein [Acidimicrobiaceae bacterium]